jgi:hypothetical protein
MPLGADGAGCFDGSYKVGLNNRLYLLCVPPNWIGDLVVLAHGYVSPKEDLAIADNVIPPDNTALVNIERGFQTSGDLLRPVFTSHTTADPIVPYWHETIYDLKALIAGSLL